MTHTDVKSVQAECRARSSRWLYLRAPWTPLVTQAKESKDAVDPHTDIRMAQGLPAQGPWDHYHWFCDLGKVGITIELISMGCCEDSITGSR